MSKREFDPFPQDWDPIREHWKAESLEMVDRLGDIVMKLGAACPNFEAIGAEFENLSSRSAMAAMELRERVANYEGS